MYRLVRAILAVLIAVPTFMQPASAGVLAWGTVVVEADGTGVFATSFPSLIEEEGIFFFLALQEATQMESRRSVIAPLPDYVEVVLNDEVVLTIDAGVAAAPVRVALNPAGEQNRLLVTAHGAPGSAARVSVVSVLDERRLSGSSVLPVGARGAGTRLAIHNVGPSPVAYRLAFYDMDGTLAGHTAPAVLEPHASAVRALDAGAPTAWESGAVYVEWVARGVASVSVSDGDMILDASDPEPVNLARFDAVSGGVLDANGER